MALPLQQDPYGIYQTRPRVYSGESNLGSGRTTIGGITPIPLYPGPVQPLPPVQSGVIDLYDNPGLPAPTTTDVPAEELLQYAPGVGYRAEMGTGMRGAGNPLPEIPASLRAMDFRNQQAPYTPLASMAAVDVENLARLKQAQRSIYPEQFAEEPEYNQYTEGLIDQARQAQLRRAALAGTPIPEGQEGMIPRYGSDVMASRARTAQMADFEAEIDAAGTEVAHQFGVDPERDPSGTRLDPQTRQAYLAALDQRLKRIQGKWLLFGSARPLGASQTMQEGGFSLEQ